MNLALFLISSVDCDSQTKIIDQDSNQIIVRAKDARLQPRFLVLKMSYARKNPIGEKNWTLIRI